MFHITVMSRQDAIRTCHKPSNGETTAMVSISTPDTYYTQHPRKSSSVQKICYVEFYDITTEYADDRTPVISEDAADQIAKFVIAQHHAGTQHLIIHCDAGQSRSAGVAKAISDFYQMPDDAIKYTREKYPNLTVSDAVKRAMQNWYESHSETPPVCE